LRKFLFFAERAETVANYHVWIISEVRKRRKPTLHILIYAYANNHYAGHGPATIEQFRDLWYASGLPELERGRRMRIQTSLFDDPEESK
jgi:hypothetical protein